MYQGVYRGTFKHEPDLDEVLARADAAGVRAIMITGTDVVESTKAVDMVARGGGSAEDGRPELYATVGVHPTRAGVFDDDGEGAVVERLRTLVVRGGDKVLAVGETGIDHNRAHFCPLEVQAKYFETQIQLARELDKPLFLHYRNDDAEPDSPFFSILAAHAGAIRGVVHSFTGSPSEIETIVGLGLYVGINGCSLRTEANCDAVRTIPLERLLLETDAPWCDIRRTHHGYSHVVTHFEGAKKAKAFVRGSMVKSRNEPATMRQVLEVVYGLRAAVDNLESIDAFAAIIYANSERLLLGRP
ncbi:deoxyribonuclease TATDN1 [Thecamonas trahens ATCC 50062]|uniref:Deoxyribonuclease TATDN1 n=1 Tax=Thecamonas trahens ATCC 50062 TaxID=461836 RepID=A0A0L0D659_THETB|nr:deoxyribonuclease TATDN1 [Thecamonas trahens ATCC 50062]KNC47839.1 deoxyribonuclease TATDN1 [Thecamonas trahens ATCC 50062]|eukprot:XP_013759317.1 deoxyribonuclease TATDN1 [Thecamonas trahens ATCC 50062]